MIWDKDASLSYICWAATWDVRTFENDPDDLIPSLTDGETEAICPKDGTCFVAG